MNELTQIMEEENENTVVEIVVGDDGGYDADKVPEGTVIQAQRYDFTFLNCLYKHFIHMDDYGERLISGTNELGRIVAGDHI